MKWRAWGSPAVWYPTMDDRFINAAAPWGYNQQTNTMTPWNLYPQLGARTVEMPFSSSAAASCVCQHLIHWLINVDKAKGVNSNTLMKNWKTEHDLPKGFAFFPVVWGGFFRCWGPRPGRSVAELLPPQPSSDGSNHGISVEIFPNKTNVARSAQLIVLFGSTQHNNTLPSFPKKKWKVQLAQVLVSWKVLSTTELSFQAPSNTPNLLVRSFKSSAVIGLGATIPSISWKTGWRELWTNPDTKNDLRQCLRNCTYQG